MTDVVKRCSNYNLGRSYFFPGSFFSKLSLAVTFIITALYTPCPAQPGFNRVYDYGRSALFLATEYAENHVYLYGDMLSPHTNRWHGLLVKIDTLGTVIDFAEISDTSLFIIADKGSSIYVDSSIVAIPLVFFSSGYCGIALFDRELNQMVRTKEYFSNEQVMSSLGITRTNEGGFLIAGWTQHLNFDVDAFAMKVNAQGGFQWIKYYGVSSVKERALGIQAIDPNQFVLYGTSDASSFIFAIDSLGQMLWQWRESDPDIDDVSARGLNYDGNGDLVYVSWKRKQVSYQGENFEASVPVFIRRDSDFELMDYNEIEPYSSLHELHDMIPSVTGSWLGVGTRTNRTDTGITGIRSVYGRVVKLDDHGEVIWEVQDTGSYDPIELSESYLSGITESPTGSIYAVGYDSRHDENGIYRSYGWVLKISADGCADTICTTTSLYDQIYGTKSQVIVYPNPTTDHLIFEIDEKVRVDIYAEIYDLSGKKLQSQRMRSGIKVMMLDENIYSPGMYLWRVVNDKGILIDAGKFVVMRE